MSAATAIQKVGSPSEETALSEIRDLHAEVVGLARTTLEKAVAIGEKLTKQKSALGHGKWLPWVKRLPFTYKTAERYMGVFDNRHKLDTVSNLTDAYRLLSTESSAARLSTLEGRIRVGMDAFLETSIKLLELQESTTPEKFRAFLGDDHDRVVEYLEVAKMMTAK